MSTTLKTIPTLFAVSMIFLVMAFPTPQSAIRAIEDLTGSRQTVNFIDTGTSRAAHEPGDLSGVVGYDEFSRLGCLEPAYNSSRELLEGCSHIIATAVLQVSWFEKQNGFSSTTAERLLLAATETCRAAWAASDNMFVDPKNPACAASTLWLASAD